MDINILNLLDKDDASELSKRLSVDDSALFDGFNYLEVAKQKNALFSIMAFKMIVENKFALSQSEIVQDTPLYKILREIRGLQILDMFKILVGRDDLSLKASIDAFNQELQTRTVQVLQEVFPNDFNALEEGEKSFLNYYLHLASNLLKDTLIEAIDSDRLSRRNKAVVKAIEAIYFDDSSKYKAALFEVVKALDKKGFDCLVNNPKDAFKYTEDLGK